jgi:hypothetical protein
VVFRTGAVTAGVTMTNDGDQPFTVNEVRSTDPPFAVTSDGCGGRTLESGDACPVEVTFRPDRAGPAEGQLLVDDTAVGSPHVVELSGVGVGPDLTVDRLEQTGTPFFTPPTGGLFLAQVQNVMAVPVVVEVRNGGTAPAGPFDLGGRRLRRAPIDQPTASPFRVVADRGLKLPCAGPSLATEAELPPGAAEGFKAILCVPVAEPGAIAPAVLVTVVGDDCFGEPPECRIVELDERNNAATPISVPVPLPDLVFTRLDGTGLTVRNDGNVASGPFSVLVVSTFSFDFEPLQPGESASREFDCIGGTVDAIIDPNDQVTELDEANSASVQSFCPVD